MTSQADLISSFFTGYSLETEALLAWYPTRSNANLKEVRMRGGTYRHSNKGKDLGLGAFGEGIRVIHSLGQLGPEDALEPNNRVVAFIEIGVNQDGFFEADIELKLGITTRQKRFFLQPDTRTPFMMNLHSTSDDQETKGTALVLQGVFTASPMLGLSEVVFDQLKTLHQG